MFIGNRIGIFEKYFLLLLTVVLRKLPRKYFIFLLFCMHQLNTPALLLVPVSRQQYCRGFTSLRARP